MCVLVWEQNHHYVCGGWGAKTVNMFCGGVEDIPKLFVASPKPPLFVVVVWAPIDHLLCGVLGAEPPLFVVFV